MGAVVLPMVRCRVPHPVVAAALGITVAVGCGAQGQEFRPPVPIDDRLRGVQVCIGTTSMDPDEPLARSPDDVLPENIRAAFSRELQERGLLVGDRTNRCCAVRMDIRYLYKSARRLQEGTGEIDLWRDGRTVGRLMFGPRAQPTDDVAADMGRGLANAVVRWLNGNWAGTADSPVCLEAP